MKSILRPRHVAILLLSFSLTLGCKESMDTAPERARQARPSTKRSDSESLLSSLAKTESQKSEIEDLESLIKEAEKQTPPKPVIQLPALDGWTKSEPRSLMKEDHGFSVAYDHLELDDVAATVYQFTRGDRNIPNGTAGIGVKDEMNSAKEALQTAQEMGLWESVEEIDSGEILLGESRQKAIWARYKIRANGQRLNSEIYVWAKKNCYFKIRLTSNPRLSERRKKVIAELLTALGNAKGL